MLVQICSDHATLVSMLQLVANTCIGRNADAVKRCGQTLEPIVEEQVVLA